MAALDDLIQQISDPELRARIQTEADRLLKQKKFGLVFEDHIPECTPLYDIPIKRNAQVALKTGEVNDIYRVARINGDQAECIHETSHDTVTIPLKDLVVVAKFGDPIYPCLKPMDSVCNAPDSDLWHTLIEADNYHALQLLEYLYAGKVDCIYIDPPYNSGAKYWNYNNDYVDGNDHYRHSKWLSMMQKRLKIAKKLLNPQDSVLIVTIDEKEYLHLGCLLEEMFPEATMQMVSSVINPSGVSRGNEFSRTDEYLFFVKLGSASPNPLVLSEHWLTARSSGKDKLRWRPMRRQGSHDTRKERPKSFYPIFLTNDGKQFAGSDKALPEGMKWQDYEVPANKIVLWPLKPDGTDGCWQIGQESLTLLCQRGFARISHTKKWGYVVQYLAEGEQKKVDDGQFSILGYAEDGSIITSDALEEAPFVPGTQWRIPTHSAREFGSALLSVLLPKRKFPFPKSLYATHDTIRFFVANKPDALIVDFFAGSGTTLHAVNLLNAEDGGHRRCIMVTNNEVSAEESKNLTEQGFHPGDEEWEKLGIARYVNWPRSVCSIKGCDINGKPLRGNYLGSNIPMSDGFNANAVFFKLGFLNKNEVALGNQFKEILSTLWMKAGAIGVCPTIENVPDDMLIFSKNSFAVLLDETMFAEFARKMREYPDIKTIFFITDSGKSFREMSDVFPQASTYQLYRDYLDNFRINIGR